MDSPFSCGSKEYEAKTEFSMKHLQSFLKATLLSLLCLLLPCTALADDTKHTLKVVSKPEMAGTFNTNTATLAQGEVIHLFAYANSNFMFKEWTAEDGTVVATAQDFEYTMPDGDVTLTAVYEYNPANPANPAANAWDANTGNVIIDEFAAGSLSRAIAEAIGQSKSSEVLMITVAGRMNNNDFNVTGNYSNCTLFDISRVTGITEVPSYAFDYTKLESVYLPASIEKIGYNAFYECRQLQAMTIYSMVPPQLESNVFQGVPEGLIVYVPAAAIAKYQDAEVWKNFTILPIQEDIRSLTVDLPQNVMAEDYSQMWLELTNTKSGQKMHYVMTDRSSYTFANIIRNTTWNATLRNQRGDVFGRIDNIEVKDEDVRVTFSNLSRPQNVRLSVLSPEGNDVTAQCQVTWFDAAGAYFSQATSLSGMLAGVKLAYSVTLPQELAMRCAVPQQTEYVIKEGGNDVQCNLNVLGQVVLTGKVKDSTTGMSLSGAAVSASQTFGGKYSKTVSAKTDASGKYTLTISNVPTSLAISASDYISQTLDTNALMDGASSTIVVPEVALKPISGAVIALNLTYTKCPTTADDEETFYEWYSDYNNVGYSIYNRTKQCAISQYNVQYPQIVLLEEVSEGDVLELTATSKTGGFMPVVTTATIDAEQRANAAFNIVELGKINATFAKNANASVAATLYDAKGKLVQTFDYSNGTLTISDLVDGQYSLITMGSSRLFNTIYDLAQLPQTGLVRLNDYVQHNVEVKSGEVTIINIDEVPTLDESKLYYTGDNTSFTVNKSSIVAGNYLTLTGHLDFKSAYATNVSNVNLIVDLPESCQFVENSVMVGNATSTYNLDDNRVTIPMARYTDRVRFCIIPTLGGDYAPSALAQFDIDGETVTQPIGSASYTAKDLSINVPKTVAKTTIPVSGTAIGASTIEVYDGDVLIGQTTSFANGSWSATCELNTPYNLSMHNIYAKVTTKAGLELQSDTKSCFYDKNAIEVKTVEMSFYNGWLHRNVSVLFDFQNNNTSSDSYMFYTATDFTFLVDFTDNDPQKMKCVDLYVYTTNNEVVHLVPVYNKEKNCYVASRMFNSNSLPTNVDVRFVADTKREIDRQEVADMYKSCIDIINEPSEYYENAKKRSAELIQSIVDDPSKSDEIIEELKSLLNITDDELNLTEEQKEKYEAIETTDDVYRLAYEITIEDMYKKGKLNEQLYSYYSSEVAFEYILLQKEIMGKNIFHASDILPTGVYELPEGLCMRVECSSDITCNDLAHLECFVIDDNNILFTNEQVNQEHRIVVTISNNRILSGNSYTNSAKQSESSYKYLKNTKRINSTDILSWGLGYGSDCYTIARLFFENTKYIQETKFLEEMVWIGENEGSEFIKAMSEQASGHFDEAIKAGEKAAKMKSIGTKLNIAGAAISVVDIGISTYKTYNNISKWDDILDFISENCYSEARAKYLEMAHKYITDYENNKNRNQVGKVFWTGFGFIPVPGFGIAGAIGNITYGLQDGLYDEDIEDSKNYIISAISSDRSCKPFPNYLENLLRKGVNPIHDPSGFVYEGVTSNRLEGVTATAYYKEMVEDMYGDLHENVVKWNAEEYAQQNPLFTDENGFYRWDVPQGLWQVKFEKEGYETTYSDWLPVPPPQLDVNIAMKQNVQPSVKMARAYPDAVEVEFDKYMMPELLTNDNIVVLVEGKPVSGSVTMLNEEASYEGSNEHYASKIRFNANAPFVADEVTLIVSNFVKSYAGIRMQDNYSQTFSIEPELCAIEVPENIGVCYGESTTLTITALPVSSAAGKILRVRTSSEMIASVSDETVTFDKDGKAEITIFGELPGTAGITYTVDGYDFKATTIVGVTIPEKAIEVAAPKASLASGSVVEKGTVVTLSCDTPDATIYYTLDGSCPCDETSRLMYNDPIVISESITIKAVAVAPDLTESDVAEFSYIVKQDVGIDEVTLDENLKVYPLPVRDKLNVTAGGKVIKSVALVSTNGSEVAKVAKPMTMITLDVSHLAPGIYFINVATEDKNYSRKIMKEE